MYPKPGVLVTVKDGFPRQHLNYHGECNVFITQRDIGLMLFMLPNRVSALMIIDGKVAYAPIARFKILKTL